MWEDPIVAEVRRVRAAHAAQFNNDLLAIYRDLKAREQKSGRQFVSYPARRVVPEKKASIKAGRGGKSSWLVVQRVVSTVRRHGPRSCWVGLVARAGPNLASS